MTTDMNRRRTPLTDVHIATGARMVEYAGWSMPVLYTSILEEARAVRTGAGIFDISHMGRTRVSGGGAVEMLQRLTTNDVAALAPSEAQYSLIPNPSGGIIDDIIVYRESQDTFLVVINASNTRKDLDWFSANSDGVSIQDNTATTAMIAVQGPSAPGMLHDVAEAKELRDLKRFQFVTGKIAGWDATFCRTGYTGEDGFELIVPAEGAAEVWTLLHGAGAVQCGLGARDALRIEAGYPLYGHEIDDETSPVEAGLMWVVKLGKGDFVGSDRIRAVKAAGPERRLVGLKLEDRQQPRQGYSICAGNDIVGAVTSGIFSPALGRSVAMGYVATSYSKLGARVEIEIRDKRISATVCAKKSLMETAE